jgi:hypothetical protein
MRRPDFVIGPPDDPYMRRWWVIPRNRWFNIYLHQMLHDDDDRALHDHPWWNVSVILRGGYLEIIRDVWEGRAVGVRHYQRKPGHLVVRSPLLAHRLVLNGEKAESWSLFVTGPRLREWGFWCPQGWRVWTEFTKPANTGEIGLGCE